MTMITLIVVLSNFYGLVFMLQSNPELSGRVTYTHDKSVHRTLSLMAVAWPGWWCQCLSTESDKSQFPTDQKNVKKLILRPTIYQIKEQLFISHLNGILWP